MDFALLAALLALGLFLGMLACLDVGWRIGRARLLRHPESPGQGTAPVEAAVFGLLGLLLAFSFSGAAGRFEARRHLIAEESNAIGTAYARIDLLPQASRPPLQQLMRQYVDARIASYGDAADAAGTQSRLAAARALHARVWAAATDACASTGAPAYAGMLLLPALNEMGDMANTRVAATRNHPPQVIHVLLAALSLVSALLAGYGMAATRSRNGFHMLVIATTVSLTFYVILDLEYPRLGLIRVDSADVALLELRKGLL
jgi:hypothetical protein